MTTIEIKITALHMALEVAKNENQMRDVDTLLINSEKIFNWLTIIEVPDPKTINLNNNLTAPPFYSTSSY